jgi:hypothetical protein
MYARRASGAARRRNSSTTWSRALAETCATLSPKASVARSNAESPERQPSQSTTALTRVAGNEHVAVMEVDVNYIARRKFLHRVAGGPNRLEERRGTPVVFAQRLMHAVSDAAARQRADDVVRPVRRRTIACARLKAVERKKRRDYFVGHVVANGAVDVFLEHDRHATNVIGNDEAGDRVAQLAEPLDQCRGAAARLRIALPPLQDIPRPIIATHVSCADLATGENANRTEAHAPFLANQLDDLRQRHRSRVSLNRSRAEPTSVGQRRKRAC